MKAFVSYSLVVTEKHILTLLAMKLNAQGVKVVTSYINPVLPNNPQIYNCNYFIGIISSKIHANKVIKEWNSARRQRIPNILLVESRIKLPLSYLNLQTVVRYHKLNPNPAIEEVNGRIKSASENAPNRIAKRVNTSSKTNLKPDNTASWLIGGAAALLLLGFMSSEQD